MLFTNQYLDGLKYQSLDLFPGIFFTGRPGRPDSSYVISSYDRLKRQERKKEFFSFLSRFGQVETRGKWDLHHIVEKQHLKPFYSEADVSFFYQNVWPVVLVFGFDEHYAYNQVLHCKESSLLYGLKADTSKRDGKLQLLQRTKDLYRDTYRGNPVLQTIAANVLKNVTVA